MAVARPLPAGAPLSEINTTPLIDVLLVLLVMLVITIPAGTHSLEFDLPSGDSGEVIDRTSNRLSLTERGEIRWNGQAVTRGELAAVLGQVRSMNPEPEVQFEPDPQASYAVAADVLHLAKDAQLSRFGFVGNDRYRSFGRAT